MRTWDVTGMEIKTHRPVILSSSDAARVIAIQLPAGEELQEHRVHERAWVIVLAGELEITAADGTRSEGGPGLVAEFEPKEPHEVSAKSDTRLLLFLAPWPGPGHPGAIPLEERAHMRERAHQRASPKFPL